MPPLVPDLLLAALALVLIPLLLLFCLVLNRLGILGGIALRRLVHLLGGCSILFAPLFRNPWTPIIVCALILVLFALIRPRSRILGGLFSMLAEEEERRLGYLQGPIAFAAALLIACGFLALSPGRVSGYVASVMAMVVADPIAAFAGSRWGRHSLRFGKRVLRRTVEGSLAMFGATALICLALSLAYPGLDAARILLLAAIATFVEALSPSKWDDLLIPAIGCLALSLLPL
jgi:phytol kinase